MAKQLSLSGIQTGDAIEAKHVSQSIKALTGAEAYDITVSGSLTIQGPVTGTTGTLNNFSSSYALKSTTASYAENAANIESASYADSALSSSYAHTASYVLNAISSSYALSASFSQTASYVKNAQTSSYVQTAQNAISSSYALSSSYAITASFISDDAIFPYSGSAQITGSLIISSSNQDQTLQLYGSGSTIFSIEGSRGTLFSIDDDESDGKLFSVNNVSGTPVLEVHEDNTVKLGKQNGFGIVISGSNPLPNDNDAKILITGSIHNVGSTAYFNAPLTASSFKATPGVINQLTASYAISASVEVIKEISSSHADRADTASYVENAQSASYVLNAISSSYALSASFAQTASYITLAQSASFVLTSSFAQTASYINASNIDQPFTDITASGNISASGNLFISASNGGQASHKTLMLDTTTGRVYHTGSYQGGNAENGFPFIGIAQITGSLRVSGSFYLDYNGNKNIIIGSGSGENLSTGISNIIIGNNSATSLQTGEGNIILGDEAGVGSDFNDENNVIAIGLNAGKDTDFDGNIGDSILIGKNAGRTGNSQNTIAIGTDSGYANNSTYNVLVGFGTKGDGTNNVGLGYSALGSGAHNYSVAIGSAALGGVSTSNSTGNIAIGYQAFRNPNTNDSNYNIAIGYQAYGISRGTSEGIKNIAMGYQVAPNIFEGNNNIIIGDEAANELVNGNNNIIIGQVAASGSGDTSDKLFIGSGSFAIISGSLNTGNLIFKNSASAQYFSAPQGITNDLTASYAITASHALNVATPTLQIVTNEGASTTVPITASIISSSANIIAQSFTGSLSGSALEAISSSYALTASYAVSSSHEIIKEISSSHADFADTASYVTLAQTASYVTTAQTASYVLNAISSSYALTASYAVSSSHEIIKEISSSHADFADTASYVENAQTASYITTAQTASYVLNAISSSYALTASYAISASHEIIKEISSSYADTASYVETAQTASFVTLAQTASYVTTAQTASYVLNAVSSSYALTASHALNTTDAKFLVYTTGSGTDSRQSIGSGTASGTAAVVLGGKTNTTAGNCAVIAGGNGNTITAASTNGFIGGGKSHCICDSTQGTIAGGDGNRISGGCNNTVSGGYLNHIRNDSFESSIGGGINNQVCENYGTVSGGYSNTVNGNMSVIGGGKSNCISGTCSGILGGISNTADANKSFIVGSDISSTVACHTHVNNLTTTGNITGSNICATGRVQGATMGAVDGNSTFTGSFTGNGSGLSNIPASGITGLNLSRIASGSVTASISPNKGFEVNTDTNISGSLILSGSSHLISGSTTIYSTGTPGLTVQSNSDTAEEVKIYDAKIDIEDSGYMAARLSSNAYGSRVGILDLRHWAGNVGAVITASPSKISYISSTLLIGKTGDPTATGTYKLDVNGDIRLGNGATDSIEILGPVTASGNISASGYISASEFVGLITNAQTASYVENAQTASYVTLAQTSSYVTTAQTASYVTTAQTASYVLNAVSSSYALTASYAVSASHEIIKEISSSYADTASFAQSGNGIFSGSFSGSFQGDGTNLNLANNTTISTGTNLTQSIFVTQNGDDTTGTIGNISKPFATLESASQAATTGSTIFVYPGTYTLGTDNLAREGVDYYFYPNTIVNQSNSTTIFDQNGFNLACNIYGSANFNITSTGGLVYFGTTNGFRDYDFTFQAQDINYSTGTAFSGMPKSNRIFSIDIRHSSGSGRFYHAPGNTLGSGRIDIKADTIESGNNNVFNTQGGINSIRIKANRIYTPNAVSIRTYNSSLDADVQYAVGDTYGYSFTATHGGTNNIRGYTNGINHANPSKTVFNGIVGKLDISNGEFHGGVANNGTITGGESSFKWHTTYTDTFSISGGVTSIELADSSQYMGQLSVSGTAKVIVTGYKQGANSNYRYSISGGELIYKAHTLYPYNDNGANYAFDLSGGLLRMQGYIKNQLTDSDAQPQQSACIRYRGGELILDGATLIASSSVAPAIWVTDQDREVKIYSGGVNTNKTGSMGLLAASSSFGSGGYALTNPLGGMIIEDASVE